MQADNEAMCAWSGGGFAVRRLASEMDFVQQALTIAKDPVPGLGVSMVCMSAHTHADRHTRTQKLKQLPFVNASHSKMKGAPQPELQPVASVSGNGEKRFSLGSCSVPLLTWHRQFQTPLRDIFFKMTMCFGSKTHQFWREITL